MKWLLCGAGVVLLAGLLLVGYKKMNTKSTDDVDGGVVKHQSGDDSPKVIESAEITEFHCEFSLLAAAEPEELENRIYKLDALYKGETVHCTYKRYGRGAPAESFEFEADAAFLESLQEIVSRHDLASHNGYVHTVSGLPDMYGALIDIRYASGESIYAHNNQDCFMTMESMGELNKLFMSQGKQ
ncbi:MAG: hypothetical protein IJY93_05555 [Clostridia bacterium]|nr:hypothetical protein [Clostridia bacterium]